MLSRNEWDPLKKVIVGIADHAKIPKLDLGLRTVNYADIDDDSLIPHGPYPQQVIDEANEDLEIFCKFLKSEGVEVLRPDTAVIPEYYNYCPRDSVLVYDQHIIATPQPLAARKNEFVAMQKYFNSYVKRGCTFINLIADHSDCLYNLDCLSNKDVLALTDHCAAFDAANILRDNDNLYYLISNSGNYAGYRILQQLVGTGVKVWPLDGVYSYMHIDSTLALLREGLLLANPARIKHRDQLPLPLQKWKIIWAAEPVDIGHYPGICNASPWLNINLFSINPHLVVLEEHQHPLRKQLESEGIECAMLPGRQQRTLGGGFHCVTLDLERD